MGPRQHIVQSSGTGIEVLVWEGNGHSPPVVLVPGMLDAANSWERYPTFLTALRKGGTRSVYAISLRGRGKSGTPRTGWKLQHHVQDLEGAFQYCGIAQAILIGCSVGAAYSLGFAEKHPDQTLGLVVGDYYPLIPKFTDKWEADAESLHRDLDFSEELPSRIVAESERESLVEHLPHLEVPILVLRGTSSDDLLASKKALDLWDAAPNRRIIDLQCGHEVFADPAGQAASLEFIASLTRSH